MAHGTAARIVDSAAGELRERGVFSASLEAIRRRANVSTGSTYHHFPGGMPAVGAEVYRSVLLQYQRAAAAVLDAAPTAEEGVRAVVIHLLAWVESDPGAARLLYQLEGTVDPAMLDDTPQPLAEAIDTWLARFGNPAATRHRVELIALWSAPAKEYARVWTRNPRVAKPTAMGTWFADAAWQSVKPFVRARRSTR